MYLILLKDIIKFLVPSKILTYHRVGSRTTTLISSSSSGVTRETSRV